MAACCVCTLAASLRARRGSFRSMVIRLVQRLGRCTRVLLQPSRDDEGGGDAGRPAVHESANFQVRPLSRLQYRRPAHRDHDGLLRSQGECCGLELPSSCPAARAMSAAHNRLFVDARSSIAIARASRGAIYLSATDIGRLFTDGTGDGAKLGFSCGFSRLCPGMPTTSS